MNFSFPLSRGRLLAAAVLLASASSLFAAPPDLTAGGVPDGDPAGQGKTVKTINLGPTGMRGWVYYVRADTSESRQILVTWVDTSAGSPANGVLEADDVILGASGDGSAPANFTSDARKSLALAIADAEANNPATLQLLRWRAGVTTTQSITLQNLGPYTATAPYSCWKSSQILAEGVEHFLNSETSGRYTFGAMALLAADDPSHPDHAARRARLQAEAHALIPDEATRTQLMSDEADTAGFTTWPRGHILIFLSEYYLVTGDAAVLPAIEAYAINIAKNSSLFGTVGHKYAEKNLDGSNNGPMGGVYGVVNSAGMPCFLGVQLAKECGLTNAEINPCIERMSRFFSYYAGRGAVPYGEHEAFWQGHENNGKSGLAALSFMLQPGRVTEGQFFAKMATASSKQRDSGHTGAFFNYLWAPLGAACGGEEAAAAHFGRISWMLDLHRRWDGGFDYDSLNREGAHSGSQYNDFRMSTAALLTYALPMRRLHLTGRGHDPARNLSSNDVAWAITADDYDPAPRTTSELIADLGIWSPKVQRSAAEELATRSIDAPTLAQITALANDSNGTSRIGACLALGKISDSGTADARAATLAALLTDPGNHVRFMAAEAMRYLPTSAKMSQINTILSAADTTAQPLTPYDEDDPLHFAHGRLGMLLFYSGNAYGPKGVLWNDLTGIDRNFLYPAIRGIAATPVGQARSTLGKTYEDNLTQADVEAVADAIVESVMVRAPADKMFSAGVRQGGIEALQKYGYAEGVPLAMIYMVDDTRGSNYNSALGVLEDYAGGSTTVLPDPDVIGFCESLLGGNQAAAAQAVLDAIAADSSPTPLTPLKSISSVVPTDPSLTLPEKWTILQASAVDLAQGDSVFTWRKIHGAGEVTFTPNGTTDSDQTTVLFDGVPGQYLFEVTMTDSRGLTEVTETVGVTLFNTGGTLPPNSPPTANPQSLNLPQATPTPVTLTASDPEGYPLLYTVTSQPTHGTLSGTPPYLLYTSEFTYTGGDSFGFEVMDSEGQTSSATINLTVDPASAFGVAVYEPFDYPVVGGLNGQSGSSEVGLAGTWSANSSTAVTAGSLAHGSMNVVGNSIGNLNGGSNRFGGARTVNASALAGNGLLADGATLWFSALMGYDTGGNVTNSRLALVLGNEQLNTGNYNYWLNGSGTTALGVTLGRFGSNGRIVATQVRDSSFGDGTSGNVYGSVPDTQLVGGEHTLVVGKITWADTAGGLDTVEIYNVPPDLGLPAAPISVLNTTVDQSGYNIISWSRGDKVVLDEIRFGATYHSVLLGNAAMTADTSAPVPDPVAFDTPPAPSSGSTITMTAATAYDPNGVEYYFACTAGGGNDSGWQDSPGYTDTGLTPGVLYSYTVKTRDKSPAQNETTPSAAASATIPTGLTVPNVVGMLQTTGETIITGAEFAIGAVTSAHSASVPVGDIMAQTPPGDTSAPLYSAVDLVVSLGADLTSPTIATTDIVDDQGGGSVLENTLVIYTLTFSEDIDALTVDAGDFANTGTAPITMGAITETSPGTLTIEVTPTAPGTLQLHLPPSATLSDAFGNPLTGLPVEDNDTLTVEAPASAFAVWADSAGLTEGVNDGPATDADSGGKNNLYEFAFGGNPLAGNDDGALMHQFTADGDGDTDTDFVLTVLVRSGASFTAGAPAVSDPIDGIVYTISGGATLPVDGAITVNPAPGPLTGTLPAAPFGYQYKSFILEGSVSEGLAEGYFQATVAPE